MSIRNTDLGCRRIIEICAAIQPYEELLIITDDESEEIGDIIFRFANKRYKTILIKMEALQTHGTEPLKAVEAAMAKADIILGATKYSLYNTRARINACKNGSRFLNLSDYSLEMLERGSLFADFDKLRNSIFEFSKRLPGKEVKIETPGGTNFSSSIIGREPDLGLGTSKNKGDSSSPPNIEAAIGPADNSAEGTLVIDGSIPLPGFGVIKDPVVIKVEKGFITKISGGSEAIRFAQYLRDLNDPRVYLIAEIGFGLNPLSKLCGRMLVDEGTLGTMHIGIGNNLSYGGNNDIPSHIDMIMLTPTCTIDGKLIMKDGVIQEE